MVANQSIRKITIIGAGPVGAITAIYLAQRGYHVTVYESRADMRQTDIVAGRSINLALSHRGIRALTEIQLMAAVEPLLIPMTGRLIHDLAGNVSYQAYGQQTHEVIYSVSRGELNKLLMTSAEQIGVKEGVEEGVEEGKVEFFFGHKLQQVDFDHQQITLFDETQQQTFTRDYQLLIGADGIASQVRKCMFSQPGLANDAVNQLHPLGHSYKELTIPALPDGGFRMAQNGLHIWPRGEYMMIALPNLEGSFTVTLFLPNEGENSFAQLTTEPQLQQFFSDQFPDALALIPNLCHDFFQHPTGHLDTLKCSPWHSHNNTLLIGDAAHAIVPFHGQGMNCGFEDATVLNQILANHDRQGNWAGILADYQQQRKANGDAIADLALDNYIEMRSSVRKANYLLNKALAFELEKRHPNVFVPRYSMVMFHHIPYAVAKQRAEIQTAILDQLTHNIDSLDEVDYDLAATLIQQRLNTK